MKKNIYLFQPQYSVEIRTEPNYWLPYAMGCLWSYAQQFDFVKENFTLGELFFARRDPVEVLAKLADPVVCGFSCYVWNEKYCIAIAKQIKEKFPNCKIVFGGPNTSARMLRYNFIDSLVLAEGEETFVSILQSVLDNKPLEEIYSKKRLNDLDIPSPYTTGVFDQLIADNPEITWAAVLETNRGCPYQCTFCDWGSATYSKVRKFNLEKVFAELEWMAVNPIGYMFGADANFGMYKERDIEIAKKIQWVAEVGKLETVNFQYAKHSTETAFIIASIFGKLSRGVTLSVQSMNDATLKAIKRKNMDINKIADLIALSHKYNVETYTEVILGLPEETLETWKTGIGKILEMGQDTLDVWFASLLENSELNTFESRTKYGIKSVVAEDYMPFFRKEDYTEIKEEINVVTSTNVFPLNDIVDAYIFSWVVIHLHTSGYTSTFAKFCRYVLNVSYEKFYSTMIEKIKNYAEIQNHVDKFKNQLTRYLETGKATEGRMSTSTTNNRKQRGAIEAEKNGHAMGANSFLWFYLNRALVNELARECTQEFTNENIDWLSDLSDNFIYNPTQTFPKIITYPYDITTWIKQDTEYSITSKHLNLDIEKFDFYISRRKGLLKNDIVKI